jgi:hypothetical protein
MTRIPHWQWLMLSYFILVAVPVFWVHLKLKKRVLANRTFLNFIAYFIAVIATALIMNSFTMWLYFTFFFTVKD